jgi:hypothetical protein
LTPVVKVTSGVEENSLVIFLTWSSIAEKPASKAIEEENSASEGEVPVLESSYCSTPMVSGNRRSREPLIKSVLKKQNSTTSAEQNKGYVIVGISEWEEMVGIIGGALRDRKESVGRVPRTRGYVRREKGATMTLGIKKSTTLKVSGSSRRVGEKENVSERGVTTRKGNRRLTKAGGKGCRKTDLRPSW